MCFFIFTFSVSLNTFVVKVKPKVKCQVSSVYTATAPWRACPRCWKKSSRKHCDSSSVLWGKEVLLQDLTFHDPIHWPLNVVKSSWTLRRRSDVSPSVLHCWGGALWSYSVFLFLQTQRVNPFLVFICRRVLQILSVCQVLWIISMFTDKFRRPGHVFSRAGALHVLQQFSPLQLTVLPVVFLVTQLL